MPKMCYDNKNSWRCGYCESDIKPRTGFKCKCGAKVYIRTETIVRKTVMVHRERK